MNVAAILRQKGRSVTTATSETTVQEISRLLAAKRIGAAVIVDVQGRIAGIVSERDIIRAIAEHGDACLAMPVDGVMTRNVETCEELDTLDELMAKMTSRRFRHLPVTGNDRRLHGIVSIGDVVKLHMAEVEMEASAMRDYIAAH